MTVQALPWSIQGQSHHAEIARSMTAGLLGAPLGAFTNAVAATTAGGSHGVVGATDLSVAQNGTPNMSVNVSAGRAFIRSGNASSIVGGTYAVLNDATVNVAISAADPTNPRIDLVVIQVRDAGYGEAANDVRITVVTGTPAASPAVPALTLFPNALVLAQVAVAAAAASITNANITDKRTRAAALGGVIACTSTTRPTGASLFSGLEIWETDTLRRLVYDGSGWVITYAQGTYTPTITGAAIGTGGSAINTASYTFSGGLLGLAGRFVFGTAGTTFPSGTTSIALPAGFTLTQATGTTGVCMITAGGAQYIGTTQVVSSTGIQFRALNVAGTYLTNVALGPSAPGAWAAGDGFIYNLCLLGTMV